MKRGEAVGRLLPLKPAWFHILLALKEGEAHGYAIRERVELRTGGKLRLWPATLYGAVHQLSGEGLIEAL
ncbi:MAG: helix-turn-helix transcriptional regulator, partial [Gemmatimonadota bacterium]